MSTKENEFTITLTTATGFTDGLIKQVDELFQQYYSHVLLTREFHDDGRTHLHAVISSPVKNATSITKRCERIYTQLSLPIVKGVSIKCKKVTHFDGAVQYCMKDVPKGGKPVAIKGWDMKTLEDQMLKNLKQMPRKMVTRDDYYINQRTATSLLIEFAKRTACPIIDKITFKMVVCAMMKEGYQFDAIKLAPVYVQIIARSGDTRPAMDWIDGQLFNLA